jgi:TolB-like protein/class 3 adenylate cyclase/Flp pilus assembly protein TadD
MAAEHVERKLTAILAADVVGYSRLVGEDEAGTVRAVRDHRKAAAPLVASHGGRLVKTMGDGLLLEFPSVVTAVECALAMQKQMVERNADVPEGKRIVYRIGVNLGDVLVDGEDILGEGVNIAARLEGIAEPGGICLSSSAYDHVRGKIDAEFVDLGDKELKNIARPVRVYAIKTDMGGYAQAPTPLAAAAKPGAPRLSIVVLPFANIGGDADQDYFVDGVTESLTTDLSRIHGSFVIGRHTAFTYKGKALDLKQIGQELNVRYVLAGSVQRGGNRMRVNVQLIDAETVNHLWAERFDKPVADLFDMQDEIAARLANALNAQLVAAEARRAECAPNPDSMDLYFQGRAWLNKGLTPEYLTQSRHFFERALALDAGNIEALVGTTLVDTRAVGAYMSDDRAIRLGAAEAALTKALSLAPEHALAHLSMGVVQIYTNRAAEGITECERALALDRNLASAHAFIGLAKLFLGQGEEIEAHINEALRFSPRDANAFAWRMIAGLTLVSLGRDEEAVAWLRSALETNRNVPLAHFGLGAALVYLGRLDDAQTAIKAGLALDPTFSISRYRAGAFSDNPIYLAQRERLMEGMRNAGAPEG